MLSSLAIVLLPLILSGCGPEILAISEVPGISKGPGFLTTHSQESQGQETSQSQELRQLLATPGNPIPQSECSYQCSKLGYHNGGKCANSYCRCLVEHREVKTLWNGWVSEGTCSPITLQNERTCPDSGCCTADPYKCDFPDHEIVHGICGPPGPDTPYGYSNKGVGENMNNGKLFATTDVCELWADSFEPDLQLPRLIEKFKLGEDQTPVCVRFADIAYACSA